MGVRVNAPLKVVVIVGRSKLAEFSDRLGRRSCRTLRCRCTKVGVQKPTTVLRLVTLREHIMRTLLATLSIFMLTSAVAAGDGIPSPKVLIITGDHEKNWKETTPVLKEILIKAGHKVDVTEKPRLDLTSEKLGAYDVLLLNYKDTERGAKANLDSVWTAANKQAFAGAVKAGTGSWSFMVLRRHSPATRSGNASSRSSAPAAGGSRVRAERYTTSR